MGLTGLVCSVLFWVPARNSLAREILGDSGMANSLCALAPRGCLQNQVSHSFQIVLPQAQLELISEEVAAGTAVEAAQLPLGPSSFPTLRL